MATLSHVLDPRDPAIRVQPTRSLLLASPAVHGSLGDEAMVVATRQAAALQGWDVSLLTPGSASGWADAGLADVRAMDDDAVGAGFLVRRRALDGAGAAVVLGADAMDAAYGARGVSARIDFLNQAARAGIPARLVNFSIREGVPAVVARLLRRLEPDVGIWVRDEASRGRAEDIFGRRVGAVPDIAFSLMPDDARRSSPGTIALVVNGHLGLFGLGAAERVHDYFLALGSGLLERADRVLVVAHDLRPTPGDPALAERIAGELGERASAVSPVSAASAKGLLGGVDLCVTARMHAAVAALSSGVPTVGLDYLDKFRGQFEWYGQGDAVTPANGDAGEALAVAQRVWAERDARRAAITAASGRLRSIGVPWMPGA
ncbi:polysaccharide pyruvyl transferase family protein [Microbacterium lacusdiani]